ncbi:MAG: cbb3-type cytochrome oxidase assembly protein CcoS [Spirochaetia bacterium]|nr:cbb3-type cytochrome oxidase assembly protein CcoS [Spirochaetia bacterium]
MEAILFLIPVAALIGLIFLGLFLWALKNGQFDDMKGPSERIMHEDDD